MRTAYKCPKGWVTRYDGAKFLDCSEWKFVELARKYNVKNKKDRGVYVYDIAEVEALAIMIFKKDFS